MLEIRFLHGTFWVLEADGELAIATMDDGSTALLVFSDDDLATTYAERSGVAGKTAKPIMGNRNVLAFLEDMKLAGVTCLAADLTHGKTANTIEIDNAIRYVREACG